jgi:hypothetical protein
MHQSTQQGQHLWSGRMLYAGAVPLANGERMTFDDARRSNAIAACPWLFARLPQGEFTVDATDEGRTLSHKTAIKGTSRRKWVFRFDAAGAG